ncbi:MAG TPA: hypothetical protein VH164_02605, partial [Ktedonobacteraceae bacterium]|nr:hypothetical protein [Ktedonobacteraceae bacterium]
PAQAYLPEEFKPESRQNSLTYQFERFQALLLQPRVVRMLAFSMFTLYCFTTWGPQHTFIPFLPDFVWSYLSGVWAWVLPILFFCKTRREALPGNAWQTQGLARSRDMYPNNTTDGEMK